MSAYTTVSKPIWYPLVIFARRYLHIFYLPEVNWRSFSRLLIGPALLLFGLGIPFSMMLGFVPASFSLAFAALAIAATGGMVYLKHCGEI